MTAGDARGAVGVFVRSDSLMSTVVTIEVHGAPLQARSLDRADAIDRALGWFRQVEAACSRFDPDSEVSRLSKRVGAAVRVSAALFHATEIALAVAAASDGAFDPTVGLQMAARGFNRNYRTGRTIARAAPAADVSFRDVELDARRRTITLRKPLLLDLGGVAKGLAVDLAARQLAPFEDFVIDAGGDLYLAGRNHNGERWRVGVRHPREANHLVASVRVSNRAVCTSGDYERRGDGGEEHHIINPRTSRAVDGVASVTVIAPAAVLADALGTAVFVLGVRRGLALLRQHRVDGLIVTSSLAHHSTRGMHRDYELRRGAADGSAALAAAVLRDTEGPADRHPDDPRGDRRAVGRGQPARTGTR